ncbi:hypothetical protein GP486_000533 [Trichoglossum hirsutum]|uniref:BTB domain-containing protein n=1 Tax=Trichoglossum hirsutum TaxID=265104 RepID=A0A9P8RTG9_9PEZI|nr:hypothetical protein GP486_000533 [Trichoglossum hirsutum]
MRGPPSVASTSRRHGRHRSHYGGSSYQPQNDFPVFTHTGDVEILVSAGGKEQKYLLHRLILAQCSGFFEAGTSEEWSRAQALSGPASGDEAQRPPAIMAKGEGRSRWRYELDWGDNSDGEVPMLVQKNPSSTIFGGDNIPRPPPARSSRPAAPQNGFFRSMANFSALHIPHTSNSPDDPANDILRDYDNLFRIFYNYTPALDALNIASAYVQCKSLLLLADMYDALEVVGPRVDHHLLQFQGRLWKQIAKYPPSYLKLGYMARSKVIFKEALVHVVGQWPRDFQHLRNQLPEQVLDVIEDKVEELEDMKAKIEGRLFRLTLTTPRGDRVTPTNNYLDWTAVSLFRQWLAENTTPSPSPPPPPSSTSNNNTTNNNSNLANASPRSAPLPAPPANTGRIYRLIGQGGPSYLGHDELKRFLKLRPEDYSRDNLRRFERRMEELKGLAREHVKPLMRNTLEMEMGGKEGGGIGYLTCTKVGERDFPWEE